MVRIVIVIENKSGGDMKIFYHSILMFLVISSARAESREQNLLNQLQPQVKELAIRLLEVARAEFPDQKIVVAETFRSQKRQNELFKRGKSVTAVKVSKHTLGRAFDLYFVGKSRILEYNEAPYDRLGEIAEEIGLNWGGRWQKPFDPGHFEIGGE